MKELKIDPSIKELQPSEYQYGVERRRTYDEMREIQKDVEKQSVLMSLVQRSVLLYGRRSITYLEGGDKKRRTFSMDLHTVSHSIELPRSQVADPVGLNMRLLAYRGARKK